jgi:hypothetical protein
MRAASYRWVLELVVLGLFFTTGAQAQTVIPCRNIAPTTAECIKTCQLEGGQVHTIYQRRYHISFCVLPYGFGGGGIFGPGSGSGCLGSNSGNCVHQSQ